MEILASLRPIRRRWPLARANLKAANFPLRGEFIRCQNRLRRILLHGFVRVLPLSALPLEEGGRAIKIRDSASFSPLLVPIERSLGKIGLGFPGRWGNFGLCLFPSNEFSPTLIKEE